MANGGPYSAWRYLYPVAGLLPGTRTLRASAGACSRDWLAVLDMHCHRLSCINTYCPGRLQLRGTDTQGGARPTNTSSNDGTTADVVRKGGTSSGTSRPSWGARHDRCVDRIGSTDNRRTQ